MLQMKRLQCFMYVSSAYFNAHLEKNSTVREQLHPLQEPSGQQADHAAIVERLLAMPVEQAQAEVCFSCPPSSCIFGSQPCLHQLANHSTHLVFLDQRQLFHMRKKLRQRKTMLGSLATARHLHHKLCTQQKHLTDCTHIVLFLTCSQRSACKAVKLRPSIWLCHIHILSAGTSHHKAPEFYSHQLWLLQEPDRTNCGGVSQQALSSLYQQACGCGLCGQRALPWLCGQHLRSNRHYPVHSLR